MLDLERNEQILAILRENKACTVYELSQKLFVSESTIRRDLSRMEQKGLVTRTFGGAILKSNPIMEDTSFFLREKENLQDKRALVKEALPFIQNNMAETSNRRRIAAWVLTPKRWSPNSTRLCASFPLQARMPSSASPSTERIKRP